MSINVKPLYVKAAIWRPDITDTAIFQFCMDDIVGRVARETMAVRATLAVAFADGQAEIDLTEALTAAGQGTLVKIHEVSGLVVASSDASVPVGTTFEMIETVYSGTYSNTLKSLGNWAQFGDKLRLYAPASGFSGTLSVVVSYEPVAGTDPVPLPASSRDALDAGLEMLAYRLPGKLCDFQKSLLAEARFKKALGKLRAAAYWGESGQPEMRIDVNPYSC